jgi:hypothetical protein
MKAKLYLACLASHESGAGALALPCQQQQLLQCVQDAVVGEQMVTAESALGAGICIQHTFAVLLLVLTIALVIQTVPIA